MAKQASEDAAEPRQPSSVAATERALWLAVVCLSAATAFSLGKNGGNAPKPQPSVPAQPVPSTSQFELGPIPKGDSAAQASHGTKNTGRMMMKWQTPIFVVNLQSVYPKAPQLNKLLATTILKKFANFSGDPRLASNGWQPNGANQRFFEWQTAGGWADICSKDCTTLVDFMHLSTDNYLLNFGLDGGTVSARNRTAHLWATVHREGMHHMRHSHPDNLVSGVYYVQLPADAGPIVLEDPRGSGHPPFDDKLYYTPVEGDFVMFPSWLMHEVPPTPGKQPRISIAVNMPGDWETSTGVSSEFDAPLARV
eukprot:m.94230 g.94230  ORF g.94230 m.94230 type:complete len:309 (-) comp12220_c0_seq1:2131-3057(-)